MSPYNKPIPSLDFDSGPFWEACRQHRLLLQYCEDCRRPRFPPSGMCPHCRSTQSTWSAATGRGRLYSWIVIRHPIPRDVYAGDVPYVVALVDLEEGVRIPTNLDCAPEGLTAGMPLEVAFHDVTSEVTLPKFRPVDGQNNG